MKEENPMREILIDKVVLNIGVGAPGERLEKAKKLLERITGKKAVFTQAKEKNPVWGIRPGLDIGVKVTLRGKDAEEFLKKVLKGRRNKLKSSSFSQYNVLGIGVKEYIDIPGIKYDPEIGMFGMDVVVVFKRRGYRVRDRHLRRSSIGKNHLVTKEDMIKFMKEKFGVEIEEV